ncbi:MAG: hypothetical protein N2748_03540, partial [candidate division WOR-3 bacterium]|nr:hypothetical protein [candidate division WOR-3 bacterium]
YALSANITYIDSARESTNAHKLQGKDTIALSNKFVDEGQANSVTSPMITDGTITNSDISATAGISDTKLAGTGALITNLNADLLDGNHASAFALSGHTHSYIDSARISTNSYKLQGKDTIALSVKFVDEGQVNSITTSMITDGNVTMAKINQAGATTGQVLKWTGSAWAPSNDSIGSGLFLPLSGGTMTGPITSTGNPEITMGKGNFGSGNINSGTMAFVAGSNNRARGDYSVISGGGGATLSDSNSALGDYSTVSGGRRNSATSYYATVGGGYENSASFMYATVGGGLYNSASSFYATVAGGYSNSASGYIATISGGESNSASGNYTTVGGGLQNSASGVATTVVGGGNNSASGENATVVGGGNNSASGYYTTVAGGYRDTSAGQYSFTTNYGSKVPSTYSNSSAFN